MASGTTPLAMRSIIDLVAISSQGELSAGVVWR
jgi:hypothetical protein